MTWHKMDEWSDMKLHDMKFEDMQRNGMQRQGYGIQCHDMKMKWYDSHGNQMNEWMKWPINKISMKRHDNQYSCTKW